MRIKKIYLYGMLQSDYRDNVTLPVASHYRITRRVCGSVCVCVHGARACVYVHGMCVRVCVFVHGVCLRVCVYNVCLCVCVPMCARCMAVSACV